MKTLRFFFLLIFFTCGHSLYAQDTIYRVNHEVIVAKVTEVGTYEIRYKRFSSQDGPVYVLRKTEVWKIVYADGNVDYFNTTAQQHSALYANAAQYRNSIGINSFDLLFGVITAEAEYSLPKTDITFRIPVSFGIASLSGSDPSFYRNFYYYNHDKKFSTGLKMLFFPGGHARFANYYIGIAAEYGQVRFRSSYYYNYPYPPVDSIRTVSYWGTGVVNGVQFSIAERISISMDFVFGMLSGANTDVSYTPMGRLGLTMAYRFGALPKNITISN